LLVLSWGETGGLGSARHYISQDKYRILDANWGMPMGNAEHGILLGSEATLFQQQGI